MNPPSKKNPLAAWRAALAKVASDEHAMLEYLDAREGFNSVVAAKLLAAPGLERGSEVPALYAVWVGPNPTPCYIGQTLNAGRRLWDLPFGESHHLANSFPPDCWSRVVVILWGSVDPVLRRAAHAAIAGPEGIDSKETLGLGLEHALSITHRPIFNRLKRRKGGGWITHDFTRSKSKGAEAARLPPLAAFARGPIAAAWEDLASRKPGDVVGEQRLVGDVVEGAVVFPGTLR